MMAVPPAASMAAAISGASVATITGPMPASQARRQTCTIIGASPIIARGLPGNRVAAMRAGMTTTGSDMVFSGLAISGLAVSGLTSAQRACEAEEE